MKEIIDHLQRIAKANGDHFKFHIDMIPGRNEIKYILYVDEEDDGHTFLATYITDNLGDLGKDISVEMIKDSCREWDYKYVD